MDEREKIADGRGRRERERRGKGRELRGKVSPQKFLSGLVSEGR